MTAEEERAQVVKYLRETAAIFDGYIRQGTHPAKHKHHADSCRFAAQAIEDGEHWHDAPKAAQEA